jgi:YVTN family beta-propeller protein
VNFALRGISPRPLAGRDVRSPEKEHSAGEANSLSPSIPIFMTLFRTACWMLAAGFGPLCANAASSYLVYVSNETSGDVSVIDGDRLAVTQTFAVGKRPRGIGLTPDGSRLLVAVSGSPRMGPGADPERARNIKADKSADGIVVIDPTTGRALKKLSVGSDPEEFSLSRDGKRVFVANEDTAEASFWEIESGKRLAVAAVAEEPEGMATNPVRDEVLVGCEAGGNIFVLQDKTARELAQIAVGQRPRSIAFSSDGSRAYVALEGERAVAVLDVPGRKLLSKIKFSESDLTLPMGIVISPDGKTAYVSTGRGGSLAAIALERNEVAKIWPVGKRPWGVALSPDGSRIFTANGPSNDVSVVEAATGREIARVKVGQGPWGLAVRRTP